MAIDNGHTAVAMAMDPRAIANRNLLKSVREGNLAQLNEAIEAGADVEMKNEVFGMNRQRPRASHAIEFCIAILKPCIQPNAATTTTTTL